MANVVRGCGKNDGVNPGRPERQNEEPQEIHGESNLLPMVRT
jgi:hypothetical protein